MLLQSCSLFKKVTYTQRGQGNEVFFDQVQVTINPNNQVKSNTIDPAIGNIEDSEGAAGGVFMDGFKGIEYISPSFFRYAILFKKGGVYLDIDSLNMTKLDEFILSSDSAIISLETHKKFYVQWALVFEAGHPFLEKTLEVVLDNLKSNRYPNDIHSMTGPAAFTTAINECLNGSNSFQYRELGPDYDGNFKFHYRFSKCFRWYRSSYRNR